MIGGYYTQENSSLLFSGMPEIIHQRCDGLKINIQLKILHATIKMEDVNQSGESSLIKPESPPENVNSVQPVIEPGHKTVSAPPSATADPQKS